MESDVEKAVAEWMKYADFISKLIRNYAKPQKGRPEPLVVHSFKYPSGLSMSLTGGVVKLHELMYNDSDEKTEKA